MADRRADIERVLSRHAACEIIDFDEAGPIRFTCGTFVDRPVESLAGVDRKHLVEVINAWHHTQAHDDVEHALMQVEERIADLDVVGLGDVAATVHDHCVGLVKRARLARVRRWVDTARLRDLLGNVTIRFWTCPIEEHGERRSPTGSPVVTVEWIDDVAHCTADGCEATSANDPRRTETETEEATRG